MTIGTRDFNRRDREGQSGTKNGVEESRDLCTFDSTCSSEVTLTFKRDLKPYSEKNAANDGRRNVSE